MRIEKVTIADFERVKAVFTCVASKTGVYKDILIGIAGAKYIVIEIDGGDLNNQKKTEFEAPGIAIDYYNSKLKDIY